MDDAKKIEMPCDKYGRVSIEKIPQICKECKSDWEERKFEIEKEFEGKIPEGKEFLYKEKEDQGFAAKLKKERENHGYGAEGSCFWQPINESLAAELFNEVIAEKPEISRLSEKIKFIRKTFGDFAKRDPLSKALDTSKGWATRYLEQAQRELEKEREIKEFLENSDLPNQTKKCKIMTIYESSEIEASKRRIADAIGCSPSYVTSITSKIHQQRLHEELDKPLPERYKIEKEVEVLSASEDTERRKTVMVLERDSYKCVKCESKDNLQIHHIIPKEKGGSGKKENLATLCYSCHLKAHNGTFQNKELSYEGKEGFWNWVNRNRT